MKVLSAVPVTMQATIYGTERETIQLGLVRGRNALVNDGFKQCGNPAYYEKEGKYWHYNHLSKCWYTE